MSKRIVQWFGARPVLKSTILVSGMVILAKILGYLEKIILAYYFGTAFQIDVYNFVVTFILALFVLVREIFEPVYLNLFLRLKARQGADAAWQFFNRTLRYVVVCGSIFCLLALIFPGIIVHTFAPGFDTAKKLLAIRLTRIGLPAVLFLTVSILTKIALNGIKVFVLPEIGELIFKSVVVITIVFFVKRLDICSAMLGFAIGALSKLLFHCIILIKKISFRGITSAISYRKEIWRLSWPLIMGAGMSQMATLADNIFLSYMRTGDMAALSYGKRIIDFPLLIFPYVLSVVAFPYFSEYAATGNLEKQRHLLINSLKWIAIVFVPLSILLFIFPEPVVKLIYQRGHFDHQSVLLTTLPLKIYSAGLFFYAAESVIVIFYFSTGDIKTPVKIGIIFVCIHLSITLLLIRSMGYLAIPVAFAVSKTLKVITLLFRPAISPKIFHHV